MRIGRKLITVELTEAQRNLLRVGTWQWSGGPCGTSDDRLAAVMGFGDAAELRAGLGRTSASIEASEPLSKLDWARALVATEISFVSRSHGAAGDWEITTGLDDVTTIERLRDVQDALIDVVPAYFPYPS